MRAKLRKLLVDSHLAAIIIAALLLSALSALYYFLVPIIQDGISSLALSSGSRLYPQNAYPFWLNFLDRVLWCLPVFLACSAAAWILARWTFHDGPLSVLSAYRDRLTRRFHA